MMIGNRSTHYALVTSLFLHLMILLSIAWVMGERSIKHIKLGEDHESQQAITSFILTQPVTTASIVKKDGLTRSNTMVHQKEASPVNQAVVGLSSVVSKTKALTGDERSTLLALLHAAIQAKQRYPASALAMEREGRVTLLFVLYKNGAISDLRIAQSSGTESLDQAAIQAVNDAAPFKQIDQHVNKSEEYSIDVVFELTA